MWTVGWYERRVPKRLGITKAVRFDSGDGWKDTGRRGDTDFAYAWEMPRPYGSGQFMVVGKPICSVSVHNCLFARPTWAELLRLIPSLIHDKRDPLNRRILKQNGRRPYGPEVQS